MKTIRWTSTNHPVAVVGFGVLDPDVDAEVPDELADKLIAEGRAVEVVPPKQTAPRQKAQPAETETEPASDAEVKE